MTVSAAQLCEDTVNRAVSEVKALPGYNVNEEVSSEIETFVTGSGKRDILAHTIILSVSVVVLR